MFPTLFGTFGSRRSNVATERAGSDEAAGQDAAPVGRDVVSLGEVRLVIEDGLLMVLGPDGDPVPPDAFRAAVSAKADATVSLDGAGEVSAEKALAVLQAQTNGMLVAGEKTDSWILSMLGIGPRPDMASAEELLEEDRAEPGPEGPAFAGPTESGEIDSEAPGDIAGMSIPLAIAPPCPEGLDPAQVTLIALSGLPEGSVLSAGADEGGGRWLLTPQDLEGLLLQVPGDSPQSVVIEVTGLAITGRNGDLASARAELRLECRPVPPISGAEQESPTFGFGSVPIDFDPGLLAGPAIDVVVVRGVPAGCSLSAGIHDASIYGWVLKPTEMVGLRIHAADGAAEPFTITVLGIGLGRDAPRQARELARIPVAFD